VLNIYAVEMHNSARQETTKATNKGIAEKPPRSHQKRELLAQQRRFDVNAQPSRLRKLRTALASLLRNQRVVVLLSMDFYHDSIASIADSRDEQAQRAISALDARGASGLQIDCRRGLWLLLASLHDLGHVRVQIKKHKNSAQLSGHLSQPDVTSYFTVFFLS
jgi:AmmeMemoRadiSam system protein B